MRVLLSIALVLLATVTAAAIAVFTGAISIAQQDPPVPKANPGASAPAPVAQGTPAPPAAGAQPGAPQPQPQPTVTKQETYGDWIYTCVAVPPSTETRCSIMQQLSESKSKSVVFVWRIAQDGKGGLVGIWQTPEAVLLNRGITLDAGTPKPLVIPFQTCGNGRCQAVANLAPDYLESLAKAEKAAAQIVLLNGKPLGLPLSVKGLADGLAALRK